MEDLFNPLIEHDEIQMKSNQVLFNAGDIIYSLYFIKKGAVKLERYTEEGKDVITSFYRKNQYIATASLYRSTYHCKAISIEEVVLLKYNKNKILKEFENDPKLLINYSACLSKEIMLLREQLEFISILDAENRILSFLKSRSINNIYKIPGSLKNLVSQIGLTHETLYRKLKSLEDKGYIEKSGKNILIK